MWTFTRLTVGEPWLSPTVSFMLTISAADVFSFFSSRCATHMYMYSVKCTCKAAAQRPLTSALRYKSLHLILSARQPDSNQTKNICSLGEKKE